MSLLLLLLGGLVKAGRAQVRQDTLKANRSDTSQVKQYLNKQNKIIRNYNYDRSTHKYLSRESKRFNVPSPKKYYHPPIHAQESLNAAMKALREELENSITSSPFLRTLSRISSFIDIPAMISTLAGNGFPFYRSQPVPVISPMNPYLYPQTKKGQAWRNYMDWRHYTNPLDKINNEDG